jgi:hypothetical protein
MEENGRLLQKQYCRMHTCGRCASIKCPAQLDCALLRDATLFFMSATCVQKHPTSKLAAKNTCAAVKSRYCLCQHNEACEPTLSIDPAILEKKATSMSKI